MNRTLALLIAFAAISSAYAAPRTFVSFAGVDTNPCTLAAPCRSFTAALAQTSLAGSIIALDTAGYGPVTIGQSVSLIAPDGVYAGITAAAFGTGISFSGTSAADVVTLRGLALEGAGAAYVGVDMETSLGTLYIQRCTLSNFSSAGVVFSPTNAGGALYITDTIMAAVGIGVYEVGPMAAQDVHAVIDGCRVNGSVYGFQMTQATATIINSVAAGNVTYGILATASAQVSVDRCQVVHNGTGILSFASATVRVANSTITDNATGLNPFGGDIFGRIGDNTYQTKTNILENNGTAGAFSGTYTAQ